MGTLTTLDPATIEALDFDVVLPCEAWACKQGTPPAVWRCEMRYSCGCTFVALVCDPCRIEFLRWQQEALRMFRVVVVVARCVRCHGAHHPVPEASFTPLRGEGS